MGLSNYRSVNEYQFDREAQSLLDTIKRCTITEMRQVGSSSSVICIEVCIGVCDSPMSALVSLALTVRRGRKKRALIKRDVCVALVGKSYSHAASVNRMLVGICSMGQATKLYLGDFMGSLCRAENPIPRSHSFRLNSHIQRRWIIEALGTGPIAPVDLYHDIFCDLASDPI